MIYEKFLEMEGKICLVILHTEVYYLVGELLFYDGNSFAIQEQNLSKPSHHFSYDELKYIEELLITPEDFFSRGI